MKLKGGDTMEIGRKVIVGQQVKRWPKITLLILGIVLLVVTSGLLYINSFINRSLAQIEGEISLNTLQSSVKIIRDEKGVPHINAKSERDLFITQGYIQAQDRLFQMDLARRQASGRLSEVVGKKAVNRDKYFRTLGLRRAAEKSFTSYSAEAQEVLDWYAIGVNAFIKHTKDSGQLPIEFTLLGYSPEPWSALDSLTIGKYMAFDLGGHWERQAFHYHLLQSFPEEKAVELFSTYPDNAPTILDKEEMNVTSSFQEAVLPHEFNGSNNWVVSGTKTKSGKPLLADDPHLGLATPSIWYQMHLQSPKYNVSGVIFAGIPGIILGHNDQIAWGVTNTGPDVQQLYLEKRNPDNPNEFLYDGKWEKAKLFNEPIHVKGEDTVEFTVTETRHGPIISDFATDHIKENVMSLRWTALDASTELEAILEINRASNWSEFEEGLEKFLVPTQNFVFASNDGTIAYKANGKIPIYQNAQDALLPLEGWKKENEWKGFIPFDELPKVVNPSKGFIATANNKIVGDSYPYHISNNWAQPYRYMRIEEVLENGNSFTKEDMEQLQMDKKNLQAQEFVPIFLSQLNQSTLPDQSNQALTLLDAWDYEDKVDASQPLIFQTWMQEIMDQLYEDIEDDALDLFNGKGQTTDELIRKANQGEKVLWIEEQGGLTNLLETTLNNTIASLQNTYGDNVSEWKWGDFHQIEFSHPLSSVGYLKPFFNSENPIPAGGSRVTVMAASFNSESGIVNHGASWRFVADLNDLSKASHIVGPGQAGHYRSEWYHDQQEDWVNGTYHDTQIIDYKGSTLILTPE